MASYVSRGIDGSGKAGSPFACLPLRLVAELCGRFARRVFGAEQTGWRGRAGGVNLHHWLILGVIFLDSLMMEQSSLKITHHLVPD